MSAERLTTEERLEDIRLQHRPDWGGMCRGCGTANGRYIVQWPCETAEVADPTLGGAL
jgi:hypothetical protein